jgi:penicillin amidase
MDTYLGPYRYFLPQGTFKDTVEWDDDVLVPRSHARNPKRGFFNGWNNKTSPTYFNAFNSNNDIYGPFQRAHVIEEYLAPRNDLTFEEIRDLALNIATTDSFNGGGNPWAFVAEKFTEILNPEGGNLTKNQELALNALKGWDGHFVEGNWVNGDTRAQGWVLMNDWLREVIKLTFEDELPRGLEDYNEDNEWKGTYKGTNQYVLFNVILHAINEEDGGIRNNYDWFLPLTLDQIVVDALDNVMETYEGDIPSDMPRGNIEYKHELLNTYLEGIGAPPIIWTTPLSNRSTYAHVVEFGRKGPVRIESMFPLGESGNILIGAGGLEFDDHFLSMKPEYDSFAPRDFPLFTKMKRGKK